MASDEPSPEAPGAANLPVGVVVPTGAAGLSGLTTVSSSAPSAAALVMGSPATSRASDVRSAGYSETDGSLLATLDAESRPVAPAPGLTAPSCILAVGPIETPSEGNAAIGESDPVEEPPPAPRSSDLLTEFLPFDRASLEDAIDRFLAPLEDLGGELANWSSPTSLLPAATVVATAALASEVLRRRYRRDDGEDARRGPRPISPVIPTAWSLGES